jgi:hypothetical protein
LTATTTFQLTVNSVTNTAPTITAIANQSTNQNVATSAIAFTVGDAQTAASALTVTGSSSNTTLVPNANIVFGGSGASRTVTVTPALNQTGTCTITVTVSDSVLSATTTFQLNVVVRINTAPVANSQSVSVFKNASSAIVLSATDADLDSLTYTLTALPSHGVLSGAAPNLTYTPNVGYVGTDSFTFVANDGFINSNIATVSINLVGHAPVLKSAVTATPMSVLVGEPVTFAVAVTDPDGDALTYAWDFGDGSIVTSSVSTTHSYASAGTFVISVTITDVDGLSVFGLVTVSVTANGSVTNKMTVAALSAKMNFSTKIKGKDICGVSAILPTLPASFSPNGAVLTINIGGAIVSYTLDAKGKANTSSGTVQLKLPPVAKNGKKTKIVQPKVKIQMKNGDWAEAWVRLGMNPTVTVKNKSISVPVVLTLAGIVYTDTVVVKTSTTANVKGTFKK